MVPRAGSQENRQPIDQANEFLPLETALPTTLPRTVAEAVFRHAMKGRILARQHAAPALPMIRMVPAMILSAADVMHLASMASQMIARMIHG
jgi:hypothetical protein